MFYCLKVLISTIYEKWVTDRRTDRRTDQPTDRPTDGPTDRQPLRDAWTHLKSGGRRHTTHMTPIRVKVKSPTELILFGTKIWSRVFFFTLRFEISEYSTS